MILYLVALAGLCIWGLRFSKFREDYISKDQTDALKGIFVVMIVLSHLRSYIPLRSAGDRVFSTVFTLLGQMPVVLFFFYSGYGIMESVKHKPGYTDVFFKKRIVKLLLDYNIVMLAYGIYHTCTGTIFPVDRYLLSWCGWETLANVNTRGNWFLFVILQLYLITLLAFVLFKRFSGRGKKFEYLVTGSTVALSIGLIYLLRLSGRDEYWYNTLFVYGFGMVYSIFREKIERAMKKTHYYVLAMSAVCAGVVLILALDLKDIISYSVMSCLFASFVVLITMHIRIQNPVLIWLGRLSFSVYILQRIPMGLFERLGLSEWAVLYAAACLAATLLLAQLHNWAAGKLSGALLRSGKQKVS